MSNKPWYPLIIILFLMIFGGEIFSAEQETFVRVSKENPEYFELSDGTPWIPIGVNLCILRDVDSKGTKYNIVETEEGLRKMEFYFRKLHENGGNYARIWLSCPFFEIEQERVGHYDEKQIHHLSEVLKMAKKYDIRLKLCFEHFRNLGENNQNDLFTKSIYKTNPPSNIGEFVRSEVGKTYFLNRCKKYAEYFKDNPNVFAWEIWNEVNCIPDSVFWTESVLGPVHKIFPKNMVIQSLGSLDSRSYYTNATFIPIMKMPENEVVQVHRYLDPGAQLNVCRGPMDRLAADMVKSIRARVPDKPILSTEMGAVEKSHSGPSKLYSLDKEGILLHDILFTPFFSGAAGSGHCWHWNVYIEKNNLWWHIGRFAKAVKDINPIKERFVPFEFEEDFYIIYGLNGRSHVLLWLRSQEDNWKTELVDRISPKTYTNVEIKLPFKKYGPIERVIGYDPWTDTEIPLEIKQEKVMIPKIKRSIVLRITKLNNK